jgi:hypothetical protein
MSDLGLKRGLYKGDTIRVCFFRANKPHSKTYIYSPIVPWLLYSKIGLGILTFSVKKILSEKIKNYND